MRNDNWIMVRVPTTLRDEFKDVAGNRKTTVSDLLRRYMENEVQNRTPVSVPE